MTTSQHVLDLFNILTKNFDIAIRPGSAGCLFDREKKLWEVSALINQNPGWKLGRLGQFESVDDAVAFERLLNG